MGNNLGVGFAAEASALFLKLLAQFAEILDDAVMHDREPFGRVRVGVVLGGTAVGRPAGVPDAAGTGKRLTGQPLLKIA